MDDEAEADGGNFNDDNSDDMDTDMEDFIDDNSDNLSEPDFDLRKKVEIELNRVALRKFLEAQEDTTLKEIGMGFIYSKPSDLM